METKTCRICGKEQPLNLFAKGPSYSDGLDPRCKPCRIARYHEQRNSDPFKTQYSDQKHKCKKFGIPFNLTPEYLESIWTGTCAVTGQPIEFRKGNADEGASLDRIDPSKGYVIGNVSYISARMNRIKYDATVEELEMILAYMKKNGAK